VWAAKRSIQIEIPGNHGRPYPAEEPEPTPRRSLTDLVHD
jgi:hypothetical protein